MLFPALLDGKYTTDFRFAKENQKIILQSVFLNASGVFKRAYSIIAQYFQRKRIKVPALQISP